MTARSLLCAVGLAALASAAAGQSHVSIPSRALPIERIEAAPPNLTGVEYCPPISPPQAVAANSSSLAETAHGASTSLSARPPAPHPRASCAAACTLPLPFHEAPIDAEGILARCHTGLLGPLVGFAHSLSVR